jgi:DNA-binding transcriptional MocR family regulator
MWFGHLLGHVRFQALVLLGQNCGQSMERSPFFQLISFREWLITSFQKVFASQMRIGFALAHTWPVAQLLCMKDSLTSMPEPLENLWSKAE